MYFIKHNLYIPYKCPAAKAQYSLDAIGVKHVGSEKRSSSNFPIHIFDMRHDAGLYATGVRPSQISVINNVRECVKQTHINRINKMNIYSSRTRCKMLIMTCRVIWWAGKIARPDQTTWLCG